MTPLRTSCVLLWILHSWKILLCSGLTAKVKRELVDFFAPYETGDRGSSDPSRWSAERNLEWVALRPELVVEIDFDHVSSGRIRHGAKLKRWREDKPAHECTIDQLSI